MTIIELLIVMVLLGIIFGLTIPMIGDTQELRLREAAKMLAADIEFAQTESISHPDDPRLIRFDTADHEYWIAAASDANTPITDTVRQEPFKVTFGTGRADSLYGVTIQSVNVGGDDRIQFDAYGAPDQTTPATITLACGPSTITVQITPGSGEVTIP